MTRRRWMVAIAVVVGLPGAALVLHAVVAAEGACPMRAPTAAELEAQRQSAMRALIVPGRPVVPSVTAGLGVATADDFISAESAGGNVTCTRETSAVRCTRTSAKANASANAGEESTREVLARFDPAGRLVAVDRVRYGLSPDDAVRTLDTLEESARSRLGEPSRVWGERRADWLAKPLRQAGFAYRFEDEAVDMTVTQLGRGGLVLREQHRAIPRGS